MATFRKVFIIIIFLIFFFYTPQSCIIYVQFLLHQYLAYTQSRSGKKKSDQKAHRSYEIISQCMSDQHADLARISKFLLQI